MTAKDKITKARVGIVLDLPFFASLLLRLEMIEDIICPTMWTDGKYIGYNSIFVDRLSLEETKGVLCHEVMHIATKHHIRRQNRNPEKWNIAGDYVINQILEDCKIKLPQGRLLNPAYKNMNTDQVYNIIPDNPNGNGSGNGNDPGGCGEVRSAKGKDGKSMSQSEINQIEQEVNIAVAQAAQQAKTMGKLPAGLERLVNEITNSKLNWKEILRRFIDDTAKNDYRWFPSNKKYVWQGLYLPSIKSEELKNMVVVMDTSGSINNKLVDEFATEINGIMEYYKTELTVIYCDAKIANVEQFTSDDLPIKFRPKGGSGTDFRPPFEYINKNSINPVCMLYFTDLEGTFPNYEPEYPVLWIYSGNRDIKVPFGEVVSL